MREEFMSPMGLSRYRVAKEINVPAQRIGAQEDQTVGRYRCLRYSTSGRVILVEILPAFFRRFIELGGVGGKFLGELRVSDTQNPSGK